MQYTLLQHCLGLSQLPNSAERYATNVDGWAWSIRYSLLLLQSPSTGPLIPAMHTDVVTAEE